MTKKMHYINDPKAKYVTYKDAVQLAVQAGIDPGRAYIYLAGLNIRGESYRIMGETYYSEPVKLAMQGDLIVRSIKICTHCKGLHIKSS